MGLSPRIESIEADVTSLDSQSTSLGQKTSLLDQAVLPYISVPSTNIVGRAPIRDVSVLATPRMGVERLMIGDADAQYGLSPIDNEYDGVLEVQSLKSDPYDRVRIVGATSFSPGSGLFMSGLTPYMEVTFFGTGLNLLTRTRNDGGFGANISVDGGGTSFISMIGDEVLTGRLYAHNAVYNLVSGLSLGWHTIKIQNAVNAALSLYGVEILNEPAVEATPLEIQAGSVIVGDEQLDVPAIALSYNTDFDGASDAIGAKGGHVAIYVEKVDGVVSVKKRFSAVDVGQLNLGAADHSNEEAIARHNWRRFSAGRTDDFSSVDDSGSQDKAFVLGDGTTSLIGNDIRTRATTNYESLNTDANGAFWSLTFVGTGLDIIRQDSAAGGADSYTYYVDDVSIGTTVDAGSLTQREEKVVSGLPYGTHTIRLERNAASTFNHGVVDFIIYGPKKAEIPAGAASLGSYYLMADHVANTTESNWTISQGVLRKGLTREGVRLGSVALNNGANPLIIGGFDIRHGTVGDVLEYTFFGTGFDLRCGSSGAENATLSIDGNSDFSGNTTSIYFSNTGAFNAATGNLTSSGSSDFGVVVSGLPLGVHTFQMTKNNTAQTIPGYFDIITPIHVPEVDKNNLHDRLIGSNAIRNELALPNYQKGKQHFPDGVDLGASKAKWQYKELGVNVTGNAYMDNADGEFIFSGLTIGKTYKVSGQMYFFKQTADTATSAYIENGVGNTVARIDFGVSGVVANGSQGFSGVFTAKDRTVRGLAASLSGGSYIQGGVDHLTYMILEELPNHIETNEW